MRVASRSISRPVVFLSGIALLLLATHGVTQQRGESREAPRFEGATIPEPPRQREPWQPPATTLPRFLVSASATLFEQGLADPRGCEYRAIEIGIGNVWSGDGGVVKTHGWVLPAPDGEKTRFAVAWSGLVYPTVSIGEPADPEADVKVIAEHAHATREARVKHPNMGNVQVQRIRNERRSVLGFADESARNQGLHAAPSGAVRPCRDGLGRGNGPAA